nr:MAG TPA: hypothetical protein [Caudoviricetes sp.]
MPSSTPRCVFYIRCEMIQKYNDLSACENSYHLLRR